MVESIELNTNPRSEVRYFVIFAVLEIISGILALLHPLLFFLPFLPLAALFFFYLTFLKGPFFWFIIMIVGTGLDSWGNVIGGLTVFHFGWGLSLISILLYLLFNPQIKLNYFTPINKFVLSFLFVAGLSLIYSPNKLSGLVLLATSTALFIVFILLVNFVDTKRKIRSLLITLSVVNILLSLLTFYQLLFENVLYVGRATVSSESGEKIWRASGTFEDPNVEAIFLMVGLIYAISLVIHSKEKIVLKLFFAGTALITSVGIIATFSRSGWIAAFAGVIMILFLNRNKKLFFYSIFIVLLFFVGFILFTPYGEFITFRILSIFDVMADPSITTRLGLMLSGLKMFVDNPFLGIGLRGYPVLYDLYIDPLAPWFLLHVKESHTLFITLLAELGIIGLIIVVFWFKRIFVDSYKLIQKAHNDFHRAVLIGSFSTFFALNIAFIFYGFLFPVMNLIWFVFALIYIYDERVNVSMNKEILRK